MNKFNEEHFCRLYEVLASLECEGPNKSTKEKNNIEDNFDETVETALNSLEQGEKISQRSRVS